MAKKTSTQTLLLEVIIWGLVAMLVALTAMNWQFVKKVSLDMRQATIQYFSKSKDTTDIANPDKTTIPDKKQTHATMSTSGSRVVLRSNEHGHFGVRAYINQEEIVMLVDTGATYIALTYEDADNIGLSPNLLDFSLVTQTANGVARVAKVTIDEIQIGDITVKNVEALVMSEGVMNMSLLGMNFLRRLSSFQMKGRQLILEQ